MGVTEIIEDLQAKGYRLHVEGGRLLVYPTPDSLALEILRTNKPVIISLLAGTSEPLVTGEMIKSGEIIPPCHKVRILAEWKEFMLIHRLELNRFGWGRQSLLSGLNPVTAKTWNDMPALPIMVADGALLRDITLPWLKFSSLGEEVYRVKSGHWFQASAFSDWRELWEERAAIREFEGGLTREEAEQAATEDMALINRTSRLPLGCNNRHTH
ncbi:MAG: hypothetical protein HQL55_16895 [Magnetococcales bacterium]|nr:hypothetical protein [Magnetococcales bacterium]